MNNHPAAFLLHILYLLLLYVRAPLPHSPSLSCNNLLSLSFSPQQTRGRRQTKLSLLLAPTAKNRGTKLLREHICEQYAVAYLRNDCSRWPLIFAPTNFCFECKNNKLGGLFQTENFYSFSDLTKCANFSNYAKNRNRIFVCQLAVHKGGYEKTTLDCTCVIKFNICYRDELRYCHKSFKLWCYTHLSANWIKLGID